jgi:hypothetical protein
MKYEFKPLTVKVSNPNIKTPYLSINFSTANVCKPSNGIFIAIELELWYHIFICIKPIGEFSK